MSFEDHFSDSAPGYQAYRPHYPPDLLVFLAEQAPSRHLAWDCATGSGQASRGLKDLFDRVIATDASRSQLAHAPALTGVSYLACTAEQCPLADGSLDLVVVAQALHWFDLEAFYREARRVLDPNGGLLAAISYNLIRVTPAVNEVIDRLYFDDLAGYWPAERRHVDHDYATLSFPLAQIAVPRFDMEAQWSLERLVGFLNTWSAVRRYMKHRRSNPVDDMTPELIEAWGNPAVPRPVRWPLNVRVGRFSRS